MYLGGELDKLGRFLSEIMLEEWAQTATGAETGYVGNRTGNFAIITLLV